MVALRDLRWVQGPIAARPFSPAQLWASVPPANPSIATQSITRDAPFSQEAMERGRPSTFIPEAHVTEVNQMRQSGTVCAERFRALCLNGSGRPAISEVL